MNSSPGGTIHLSSATAALALGLAVLLLPKGTRRHRRLGYGYAAAMAVMLATAFLVDRLFGRFGPFHFAAALSAATLAAGLLPAVLRRLRGRWLEMHYGFISWSYIGLVAAAAAESFVRIPHTPFWKTVVASSAAVILVGGWLVHRLQVRTLGRVGAAERSPLPLRRRTWTLVELLSALQTKCP